MKYPQMRKFLFFAAVCLFIALEARSEAPDPYMEKARAVVREFHERLRAELMAGMKKGPVHAITVCSQIAPEIASDLSEHYGGKVARTSTRPRNPKNKPDEWESSVLKAFDQRLKAGDAPEAMEFSETVQTADGGKEFRYMKAIVIPAGAPCLVCHGSVIDRAVEERIAAIYPEDRARGYKQGDLRGAFTVRLPR